MHKVKYSKTQIIQHSSC